MMMVSVLLSGKLKTDGYGRGKRASDGGVYLLSLEEGSTVREVIKGMGVPLKRVALTMINGRRCKVGTVVQPEDRVILIPSDVAALWRVLGEQNFGARIGSDAHDSG